MKAKSVITFTATMILICLFAGNSFAQLFGKAKEDPEIKELRKLNTRIVEKVIPGMNRIMSTQAELSQQIEELKASLPALRGKIETNHVESTRKIRAIDGKLSNIETNLQKQITDGNKALTALVQKQNKEQALELGTLKMELNRFKKEAAAQQDKFKIGLARDIEQFSKINQDAFKKFSNKNARDLGTIEAHLQTQNERINQNVETLSQLGQMAIKNDQTLTATLNAIQSGNTETKAGFSALDASQKAVVDKNNQMIDLLGKSVKEQQTTAGKLDAVLAGQTKTNENVNVARNTITAFKGIVDTRMGEISREQKDLRVQTNKVAQSAELIRSNLSVTDTKMNKLAEGLKTLQGQNMSSANAMSSVQERVIKMQVLNQQTHEKFNKLIDTTKNMLANASAVDKKVDQLLQKIDAGRTENNLANEKISKLISILKNIAAEQDKLQQVLTSQAKINQAVGQSASEIKTLHASQKEIKAGIRDLRRKANVSIARSDTILKALGKSAAQPKASSRKR